MNSPRPYQRELHTMSEADSKGMLHTDECLLLARRSGRLHPLSLGRLLTPSRHARGSLIRSSRRRARAVTADRLAAQALLTGQPRNGGVETSCQRTRGVV